MPADAASFTSPGVMIFILLAIAAVLYSWWLSIHRMRRLRDLDGWVREHRAQALSEVPLGFQIYLPGCIKYLRRHGLSDDPEFMDRYREINRYSRRRLAMLLLGAAAIAMVLVGPQYWGWVW